MRLWQQLMGAALVATLGTGTALAQSREERARQDVEKGAERIGEEARRGEERAEGAVKGYEEERLGKKAGKAQEEKRAALNDIALFNQEQIALGKLAQERSDNPAVKQFAEQLINNHQQALDNLERYAQDEQLEVAMVDLSQEGMAVGGAGMEGGEMTPGEREILGEEKGAAKETAKLDKKAQKRVDKFIEKRDELATRSGREFDRDFLEQVKDGQEEGADLVKDAQDKYRDDAALSQLLAQTGPVLEQNKQQLREVEREVKKQG